MAVGAAAKQLVAQLFVAEVEGVLLEPLQGLEIQIPLQFHLGGGAVGLLQHLQQQRQQRVGISQGAFECHHQQIVAGFTAQVGAEALHHIGKGFRIQVPTAAGQHPRQQLLLARPPRRIQVTAQRHHQPCRQNCRPGLGQADQLIHAGSTSSTEAWAGSQAGARACKRSRSQLSRRCSGASRSSKRPCRVAWAS